MPLLSTPAVQNARPYVSFAANGAIQTQTVAAQIRGATTTAVQQQPQQQIRIANAGQQQFVTLAGGQQVAVQMQPQVMQFPSAATAASAQQMVPVQIPVSQNGQTVYQTVQMPMATAPAIQTAIVPQVVQTSAGQQIVMQQVQIVQPQIAQPQFAQILMPNGQLQQVQVVQPQQMFTSIGAGFPQMQQIPIQAAVASSNTNTGVQTTTVLTSPIVSSSSITSQANLSSPTTTATKIEPNAAIVKTEVDTDLKVQQPQQQQQQVVTINGQQVILQQQQPQQAQFQQTQVMSLRTANGQIVQIPNAGGAGQIMQAATPTSTVHIPGIGPVQIMNAMPVGSNPAQFATTVANPTTPR